MKNILKDMGLVNEKGENNSLTNIYKKITKTPSAEKPHIKVPTPKYIYQCDLLYLPTDKGYKYLLCLIDNCDNTLDFEPMKNRSASDAFAINQIFDREILTRPKFSIESDPGSEFKGVLKSFFVHPEKLEKPKNPADIIPGEDYEAVPNHVYL